MFRWFQIPFEFGLLLSTVCCYPASFSGEFPPMRIMRIGAKLWRLRYERWPGVRKGAPWMATNHQLLQTLWGNEVSPMFTLWHLHPNLRLPSSRLDCPKTIQQSMLFNSHLRIAVACLARYVWMFSLHPCRRVGLWCSHGNSEEITRT